MRNQFVASPHFSPSLSRLAPTASRNDIILAVFFLRYMKYLYPYECEKLQLSSPTELQAAIGKTEYADDQRTSIASLVEGNRREGRRPSYAFEYSSPPQIMPPPPPPPPATTTTTTSSSSSSSSSSSTNGLLASPLAHRPCKDIAHATNSSHFDLSTRSESCRHGCRCCCSVPSFFPCCGCSFVARHE